MKKRMNKHTILYFMIWVLALVMLPSVEAQAGSINGHEAGVIAAASGTFEYDGKTYKAGSSYINQLQTYLAQDDVDLTAEQASEAISQMYASIQQGVEGGYLYEVGGGQTTTENTSETATEETTEDLSQEVDSDDESEKKADEKTEESTENQGGADLAEDVGVWDVMSNPTESKQKLENRPEAGDATAKVEMGEEEIKVVTKDNEEITISKTEEIISPTVITVCAVISILCLVITVVMGIILFAKKCMVLRKVKRRKARPGHSKRRKIRHYTRAVLTVTTGLGMFSLFVMLGIYIGLFNENAIMQNMQSSGYFRYAYSEYIIDAADTADAVSYEDYLFTIKQNSLKVLSGDMDIVIPESNVTPYIYNLKQSFMTLFWNAGIYMLVTVVLGIFLMVFMDQRRERGIKHIAASELVASIVVAVLVVIMTVYKPYTHLYIVPDYLYLFVMECINRCVVILSSIMGAGIVIGMLLVGIYKTEVSRKDN